MLGFPIIDAHLHLWDPSLLRYPWLDEIKLLNRAYLSGDYLKESRDINIEKLVFVQCECIPSQYLKEVEWVTSLKNIEPRICGIISWAPVEKGELVRRDLEELYKNKLVKGIRRLIQFEKDMEFCLQPGFIKGVQTLADYDFSFDIGIAHFQMKNTIHFVRKCPGTSFILDHIGKPDIKNQLFDPWKTEIKELSKIGNVFCKISGLVNEANHKKWKVEDLKPYIDHVIDCFGFEKIIFGGDWPVLRLTAEYQQWIEALLEVVGNVRENDLKKLFYDNAIKFYKLR